MDVIDFASHVFRLLRRRQDDIKDCLASDGLPNWEEYKKLVGELRGLAFATEEIKALLEKHTDHDQDTFSS